MNIGDIIYFRRKELGLTLEEVGNAVGVSKGTVKKWETGFIANIKRDKIAKLAEVLKLSPIIFITGNINDMKQNISEETNILENIQKKHGKEACDAFTMYTQLDTADKAEIRGEMKQMLKSSKYTGNHMNSDFIHPNVPNDAYIGRVAAFGGDFKDVPYNPEASAKLATIAKKKREEEKNK